MDQIAQTTLLKTRSGRLALEACRKNQKMLSDSESAADCPLTAIRRENFHSNHFNQFTVKSDPSGAPGRLPPPGWGNSKNKWSTKTNLEHLSLLLIPFISTLQPTTAAATTTATTMSASPQKKVKSGIPTASELCVNTIRVLGADMVQKANSGHPGAPMGCAPMADALFRRGLMKFDPANPRWIARDRFVLSNGHGCALLYTMLHLTGYAKPTMEDLMQFRQLNSCTPGHPECTDLPGVEVTTGPLGQGISNAVGLAIAEKHMAATFNQPDAPALIDNYTFVICGDGCLQEGVSSEASSLAGHLKLNKLILLYDDNLITIDGATEVSFTEDVLKRYEAYGWNTMVVANGDSDYEGLFNAVAKAKQSTDKPTIIKVRTTIGFGATKQGTEGVHGAPLGAADVVQVKKRFGFPEDKSFYVPPEALTEFRHAISRGAMERGEWEAGAAKYKALHTEKYAEFERRIQGKLLPGWENALPVYTPKDGKIASRNSSEKVLNALAKVLPEVIGGSADLTGSNKTELKCSYDFQDATPAGRYLRFGVREHGMAAICNGIAAYGGLIPFGATFLNFVGYAAGAIRLSALSHHRVLYIMTHDSIGLGEDGPTHQPVETLISLRATPNMYVFRPADATEVAGSYICALNMMHSPSTLCLSRQDLPCLEHSSRDKVLQGAYVVMPAPTGGQETGCIVATGSEVYLAIEAAAELAKQGVFVRVVSMPCSRLFDEQVPICFDFAQVLLFGDETDRVFFYCFYAQSIEYKKQVFPKGLFVVSVEAASVEGWAKYSHVQIGLTTFGKSAPYAQLYKYFGMDTPGITSTVAKAAAFYKGREAPWLMDVMTV